MRVLLAVAEVLMLSSAVAVPAACQPSTQSAASPVTELGRGGGDPASQPFLSLKVNEIDNGYEVLLSVTENGRVAGQGTTAISADLVHRNLLAHLSPERAEATSHALEERLKQLLLPIIQKGTELERKLIASYPSCNSIPPSQRKGRATFSSKTRGDPDGTGKAGVPTEYCVVLPVEGAPEANALMRQGMDMGRIAREFEAATKNEFNFEQVRLWSTYGAVGKDENVVRPYYSGIVRKAAADLAPLGGLLRRALNGRNERVVVEAVGDVVQRLHVVPLDRRRPVFPSPSAILVDGRGSVDAKATAIAALIHLAAPHIRMVLVELDDAYLLGISVPPRDGDVVIEDLSMGIRRTFVVIDPWAPVALGGVVQPRVIKASTDGRVTNAEMAMIYELTPNGK